MFVSSERLDLTTINVTQKLDMRLLERLDLGFPAIKDQQFQSDLLIAESIQLLINSTTQKSKNSPAKNLSYQKQTFFAIRTLAALIQYVVYSISYTVYGTHKPISRSLNGPFL